MAIRQLPLPESKEESLNLLCQTKEVYSLEQKLDSRLSFDGITDIAMP